jgi:membrane fusion protein (multidrug efflux system)
MASRKHAQIHLESGIYWISDLQSTNGTCLNGKKIVQRTRLKDGDEIIIGSTRFNFVGDSFQADGAIAGENPTRSATGRGTEKRAPAPVAEGVAKKPEGSLTIRASNSTEHPTPGTGPANKNRLAPTNLVVSAPKADAPATPQVQEAVSRPAWGSVIRRWSVLVLTLSGTVMALVIGISWLSYRCGHIVASNAAIKGRLQRIGARIDGQVRSIEVIPGQQVLKDQVLIRLEDTHLQAALGQAKSELQSAQKRLAAEEIAIQHERRRLDLEEERCQTLWQVSSNEVAAAASLEIRLSREFERLSALNGAQITSASDLDRARADRDNAQARLRAAQGNLTVAEVSCREAHVQREALKARETGLEALAADVERSRQSVSFAEAELAATVIRAPENGWVAERLIEPGGSAKVGDPILTVWAGAPWVEAWVDEKQLAGVLIGSPVDVSLTAFPNKKLAGRVDGIGVLTDRGFEQGPVPSTLTSIFQPDAMVPIQITVFAGQLRIQPGLSAVVGIKDTLNRGHFQVAGFQNLLSSIGRWRSSSPATTTTSIYK